MTFWPENASIFTIIKDAIIAAAALTTAILAARGLRTWQRKLRGGDEYEVARRLLQEAIGLREAMARFRNPFVEQDWQWIADKAPDFEAARLQAEVLWGKKIDEVVGPLQDCVKTLWVKWMAFQSGSKTVRSVVFAREEPLEEDEFLGDVDKAIEKVRNFVRQFMAPKPSLLRRCARGMHALVARVLRPKRAQGNPADRKAVASEKDSGQDREETQ